MNPSPWSLQSALRDILRFRRPDAPWVVALRNAAGVTLPLLVGWRTGYMGVGIWLSLGALVVMFSDQPGPYRERLAHIAFASLGASLAAWAGFVLGVHREVMIALALLVGFGGGLLVQFGLAASRIGMTGMILLVIAGASPMSLRPATTDAALILAGGLLQALFAVAAWPLGRYRPERTVLAKVYRELAQIAIEVPSADAAPPLSDTLLEAQTTLLGGFRTRGRASEAFQVLLDAAEHLRLQLLADGAHAAWRAQGRLPSAVADVLAAIAQALEAGRDTASAGKALSALESQRDAAMTATMMSTLARAVRNANWAGSAGEMRAAASARAIPSSLRADAPLAQLRATLTLESAAFRHALRMGMALAIGVALERSLGLAHGYWLPMTLAIVLRADFAATLSYGVQRAAGTVLGLLLTTFLLVFAPAVLAKILLLGLLAFAFRWFGSASYTTAVAALTGAVVILLDLAGEPAMQSMHDRLIATLLACAAALGGYLLWPTWERSRIQASLAAMLDAYAGYLAALGGSDVHALIHGRTASRRARVNAMASLERLRGEPFATPALRLRAERVFAHGNRIVRNAMNLELLPPERRGSAAGAWLMHAAEGLRTCAGDLRTGLRRPWLPGSPPIDAPAELHRLADALQALCSVLGEPAAAP